MAPSKRACQKSNWTREYTEFQGIVSTTRDEPSSSVVKLLDFARANNIDLGKQVLELGCGVGRNARLLAKNGFHVTGLDFVEEALTKLRQMATAEGLADKIAICLGDLTETLPFSDNSFDLVLDIAVSNCLQREDFFQLTNEIRRTLKPGGFSLTFVMCEEDGFLAPQADKNGCVVLPQSGVIDRIVSRADLEEAFKDFKPVAFESVAMDDYLYGEIHNRVLWWVLVQK